ncbi:MAG: ferrous iron transport protein A [Pirellulales bacterium]|nr:ferrous iron transport protein A [Pirellulales bacterium]
MPNLLPIHVLMTGQTGSVQKIIGNANVVHRLAELGIRSGARLEIVQHGSPCIIRLNDSKYCFRDTDSINVLVQVD